MQDTFSLRHLINCLVAELLHDLAAIEATQFNTSVVYCIMLSKARSSTIPNKFQ